MAWNDGLDGTALQIASTTESPLRVMAGPGTGKSFAMKRRIARLLEQEVDPVRILAVTFTRTAAGSLVEDLENLGVEGSEDIVAGTLHGYCFGLLGKEEVLALSGRVPRPLVAFTKSRALQYEGRIMLLDLVKRGEFGGARDCTKRILAFEAAWARLQSEEPGWPQNPMDTQFQAALLGWLHFHNAMLIGELVPVAHRYLRDNPACDARSAFDYVIVDEYQDLNKAEQQVIDLLAEDGETAIVGDVDQSIYRFRHANPEGIENFDEFHPHTHDENLNECRRCPTRVVSIADALIRQNHPGDNSARLRPLPGNPAGEIHVVQWTSIDEEAEGVAAYVAWLIQNKGYQASEILVLSPRRLIGYRIRNRIVAAGVSAHSFYHEEALESDGAQRAFALLTLLNNNADRVALRWWLGQGSATGRVGAYASLREHCENAGVSPWEVLTEMSSGQLNLPKCARLLPPFQELTSILEMLGNLDVAELIDQLLPENIPEVQVLREAAQLALGRSEDAASLFDSLRTAVTQPEMPEEGEFVRIMSLHKSKGLTAKVAIVAGCIRGLIPFEDRDEPEVERAQILQEQRRLFYVAITRCTEILVLSSAQRLERQLAFRLGAHVLGNGDPVRAITSQFIAELGPLAPASRLGSNWREADYT